MPQTTRFRFSARAIALLLLTGVRLREATHARVEDVNLGQRLWFLPKAKTGARHIHLNDAAVAILAKQASLAVSAGRSLYDVQALLGHASPSMTTRYAHLDNQTLRAASQTVADVVEKARKELVQQKNALAGW